MVFRIEDFAKELAKVGQLDERVVGDPNDPVVRARHDNRFKSIPFIKDYDTAKKETWVNNLYDRSDRAQKSASSVGKPLENKSLGSTISQALMPVATAVATKIFGTNSDVPDNKYTGVGDAEFGGFSDAQASEAKRREKENNERNRQNQEQGIEIARDQNKERQEVSGGKARGAARAQQSASQTPIVTGQTPIDKEQVASSQSGNLPDTAPKPTPRPEPKAQELTFGQAFKAAREKAGGAGGEFKWRNPKTGIESTFQTNIKGEKPRKNLKPVAESLLTAFNKLHEKETSNMFESAKRMKKADKDHDGDGKIESDKDEYMGSRMKAAKEAGKMKEEFEELFSEANLMHIEVGEKVRLSNPKAPARHVVTKIKGQKVHIKRHPDDREIVMPLNRIKKVKAQAAELTGKMKEEFEELFSEAELAFLEAVAPTPEDHAPNPSPENKAEGGQGRGSLSEKKIKKV
jgi:hypothetical protein